MPRGRSRERGNRTRLTRKEAIHEEDRRRLRLGIATSTAVEAKVKDLLDNNGLSGQYTITKCAIGEAPSKCADADLLVATTAAPAGISCPYVSGVPFLTTIGKAAAEQQILEALKK